jgi:hypothetical protein
MRTKTEYNLLLSILKEVCNDLTASQYIELCLIAMCILKDNPKATILHAIATAKEEMDKI